VEYRGLTLDRFQADAIAALERGDNVLVAAPTGTGKTVVADWVVEHALKQGKEVIYTAPIKALSNQKFRDYCELFGEDQVGLVTGDLVIRRTAPCRVMTTEILRNMLLTGEDLPQLAAVVIDEIHFLDDRERGTVWEEVLIYLPPDVRIVGLSATLSNLDQFANWLEEVRGSTVEVVLEEKRAVPLGFRVATREAGLVDVDQMAERYRQWFSRHGRQAKRAQHKGRQRGGRQGGRQGGRRGGRDGNRLGAPTRHHDVFRMLRDDYLPYLYFVFSRQHAESLSRDLGRRLGEDTTLNPEEASEVKARLDTFVADCGESLVLRAGHRQLLEKGIGFHHAGLHVQLKTLTEQLYEARLLKVLYCTGTFALGINMPARAAAFDAMIRFDGRKMIPLPTREFMQMAGRAGRRGMDDEGLVVVRTDMEDWPAIDPQLGAYLSARYEPVRSRFSLSFNSVVNLLHRHPRDQIREFVEKSFLAYYRRNNADKQAQNAERLSASLVRQGWDGKGDVPRHLKKQVRRLDRLARRADDQTDRTWKEFTRKVEFLKRWGYLSEDGSFAAGAKVLMQIQISEIFTTELFLSGVLEDLEPDRLFGVLTGMCTEFPTRVHVQTTKRDRRLGWKVDKIRSSAMVCEAEELSGVDTCWDPRMISLGSAWAQGKSLNEILMTVDSTSDRAGDLVGAFRRAKELAGQIKAVWDYDQAKVDMLTSLIRNVSRDEVEVVG
jgi:superfamily II RNA helicase